MTKHNLKLTGFILFVLAASVLNLTCDIGLGKSVDTKPPTVSITYPPVDSIIKNTFSMTGEANDETTLKTVTVTFENTSHVGDPAYTYGPYTATINTTGKTWSFVANTKNVADEFIVPDGSYEVTVRAIDEAGRSNVASTTYKIDNTPPVLVIQNPKSIGSDLAVSAFGRDLKISGLVADANSVADLTFTVYKTGLADPEVYSFAAIPPSIDLTLPDSFYTALYGDPDIPVGDKSFYYTITVTDYAKEYRLPPLVPVVDGNTSSVYYIYDKIYSSVFAASYTMLDLQNIFNGSMADIGNIKDTLDNPGMFVASPPVLTTDSGIFTINPANSPTFSAQTFEELDIGVWGAGDASKVYPSVGANSTIGLQVEIGRDNVPLVEDSIGVTVYYMADRTSPLDNTGALRVGAIPITLLTGVRKLTSSPDNSADVAADMVARAADLAIDSNSDGTKDITITTSGNNYLLAVYLKDSVSALRKYAIEVTGRDNNNDINNGNVRYGFYVIANGAAPVVKETAIGTTIRQFNNTGNLAYTGTVTCANGLQTLEYVITHDGTSGSRVEILSSPGTEEKPWALNLNSIATRGDHEIKFIATDLNGTESAITRNVYIDTEDPVAAVNSVLPEVDVSGTLYSNGTVTVSGNLTDNYTLATGTYTVRNDLGTIVAGPTTLTPNLYSWNFPVNTTLLTDNADATVTIDATDSAGNTHSVVRTIHVNQATDNPSLTLSNADTTVVVPSGVTLTKNLFNLSSNNKLLGTVSDDDGIASVEIKLDAGAYGPVTSAPAAGTRSGLFSHTFPVLTPEGTHAITLRITDNVLGKQTVVGPFYIGIDTDVPTLAITSPASDLYWSTTIPVTGTMSDGSGLPTLVATGDGTSVLSAASSPWSDTITVPAITGSYTKTYTATDAFGRTVVATLLYKVDKTLPTLTMVTEPASEYVFTDINPYFKVTGTADETGVGQSGLTAVYYAITAGTGSAAPANGDLTVDGSGMNGWVPATGTSSWTADIPFAGKNDSAYTVHITARDNAGNWVTAGSIYHHDVRTDMAVPIVTPTAPPASKAFGSDFVFSGTASDSKGLAGVSALVNNLDASTLTLATAAGHTSGAWRFTVPVSTMSGAGQGDGTYLVAVTATDVSGRSTDSTFTFIRDTTAPTVTVSNLESDNSTIILDSLPKILGSISDVGLRSVTYQYQKSPDGGATWPDMGTSKSLALTAGVSSLSFSMNMSTDLAASLTDGLWRVVITANDMKMANDGITPSPNTQVFTSPSFRVDRAAPAVTITTPASTATTFKKAGDTYALIGSVTDVGGLEKIVVKVLQGGSPTYTAPDITGTGTINLIIPSTAFNQVTSDTYSVVVTATDLAGRSSEKSFSVYYDPEVPSVEITTISPTVNVLGTDYVNGVISVSGKFTDNYQVASASYSLDGGTTNVPIVSLSTWTITGIDTRNYDNVGGTGPLPLTITVTDLAGNVTTLSPTINIDQSTDSPTMTLTNADDTVITDVGVTSTVNLFGKTTNNKILGSVTDDDGIALVQAQINGGGWTTIYSDGAAPYLTTTSLSYTIPGATAEGLHSVQFRVTDSALGSITTGTSFRIGVDEGAPLLSLTSPAQNAFYTGTITVEGTKSDGSGVCVLTESGSGTSILTQTATWQDSLTVPAAAGTYVKTYTATDRYGRATSVTFTYKVDNDDPTLVAVPPVSDYINLPDSPYYRFTGTTADTGGSGVGEVKYAVTSGASSTAPAFGDAAWLSAGGLASWTANVDMSGETEGAYTIHLAARDLAGNYSAITSRTVYVDVDQPTIGAVMTPAALSIYNEDFDLEGSASDTLGLELVGAVLKVASNSYPLTNSGTSEAWSFAVPVTGGTIPTDGTYQITVTAKDNSGKTVSSVYSFVRDTTAPVVTPSNISSDGSTKLIDSTPKIIGLITDTTGIQSRTVLFEKKTGPMTYATQGTHTSPQNITDVTIGSTLASFSLDLVTMLGSDLTDGIWRLTIVSSDGALTTANSTTFVSADFRIDRNDPTVGITTPSSSGTFVKLGDNITVSGTATDTGGLDYVRVRVMLGATIKATVNIPTSSFTGNDWTHTFTAPFDTSGDYVVQAVAFDLAGRTKEATRDVSCDTTPPVISFISPFPTAASQTKDLAGTITLSGKSTDGAMRTSYYNIGGSLAGDVVTNGGFADWQEFESSYNWTVAFNSLAYAQLPYASNISGTRWTLPVHVKALDMAGNISYSTLNIVIDTDIDRPEVEITSPTLPANLGGSFRVSGGASDNNFIYKVYMQVEVVGATYTDVVDAVNGNYKVLTGFGGVNTPGGMNSNGDADTNYFVRVSTDPLLVNKTAWYEIEGAYSWGYTLNKVNEFYKAAIEALPGQGILPGASSELIIRVRALDTKNSDGSLSMDAKFGLDEEITVSLDADVPAIEEVAMPLQDSYVSGTIPLTFNLTDDYGIQDDGTGLVVTLNGVTYAIPEVDITRSGQPNPPYYTRWEVDTTLDTTAIVAGGAGPVNMVITVKERNTVFEKTSTLIRRFNVDNTAPLASLLGSGELIDCAGRTGINLNVLGEDALLNGTGTDAHSGIDQIVLYFTRTVGPNTYIYTMGGTTAVGVGRDTTGTLMNTTYDFGSGAKPFPVATPADIQTGKNGAIPQKYMVIDRLEGGLDGGETGDQDGYDENLRSDGQWYIKLDSTMIDDGQYTVHYVLIDKAGKAAYYSDQMLVQNNRPVITGVVLYTDLNGDGINTLNDSSNPERKAFIPTEFGATSFTVRNSLLRIEVSATVVNTPATYYLTYPLTPTGTTTISNSTGIFTVPSFAPDGAVNGTTYSVRVEDNITPPLSSGESILKMTLDNSDLVKPLGTLSELNTLVEDSMTANVSGGSLYTVEDASTLALVKQGHIETRVNSPYDNGGTAATRDPDISGTVILRGTAFDDQRINTISLTLNGISTPVLSWNTTSKQLEPASGNAVAQSQVLALTGHTVEWSYAWNTNNITGIAGANKAISLQVTDINGNVITTVAFDGTNTNACTSMTVDVVPYISEIARNVLSYNTNRTRYGKYPLQQSEPNIAVKGFNLLLPTTPNGTNWVRVYSAETAGTADAVAPTIEAAPAPTSTLFEMTMNATARSGYLRVMVNGVEAINGINDDSLTSNKEDDSSIGGTGGVNTKWNDDRYVLLFQVGDYMEGSSDPEHPALSIDTSSTPDRLYGSWTNFAASRSYYAGPNSIAVAWGDRTGLPVAETFDPPEWTDLVVDGQGDRHAVILENFYGGEGGASTNWGFLSSSINAGSRRAIDDMGDDGSNSVNHTDGYDEMLYQFRNPRIAVVGDGTTNDQYVSYYDYYGKCLKYSRMTGGAATWVSLNHIADSQTVVDGADDFDNNPDDSGADVGLYSAIGIDSVGGTDATGAHRPVIAYYDTTNKVLKVARGNNNQPNGTGQWTIATIPGTTNVGQYVSLKIDSTGALHIAAFKNSTGDLVYIRAANINGTGSYTFSTPVVVDSFGSVGAWSNIALNGTSPIISYLNSTGIGTYDGLKYAYIQSGTGLAAADWETLVIPANSSVSDKRTSLVYSADSSWDGAVAFGFGSTNFDLVYLKRAVP